MSKLPESYKFVDLSDYGRPVAKIIANSLKETTFTPIHVTIWFIISGLIAIACMINGNYLAAAFFLVFKSILDAADGELARMKNTPSYTGRYFDSIADILLNVLFLLTLWYITDSNLLSTIFAFIGIQLQGTLFNYYYVILRHQFAGDTTSRVFEYKTPTAMNGEKQHVVHKLFKTYKFLYGKFDKAIYLLDPNAINSKVFPNWFMTAVSIFGLGFQLLIMSVLLVLGFEDYIIPCFIAYSIFILILIGLRRLI